MTFSFRWNYSLVLVYFFSRTSIAFQNRKYMLQPVNRNSFEYQTSFKYRLEKLTVLNWFNFRCHLFRRRTYWLIFTDNICFRRDWQIFRTWRITSVLCKLPLIVFRKMSFLRYNYQFPMCSTFPQCAYLYFWTIF